MIPFTMLNIILVNKQQLFQPFFHNLARLWNSEKCDKAPKMPLNVLLKHPLAIHEAQKSALHHRE
jgi:hypothetical protein